MDAAELAERLLADARALEPAGDPRALAVVAGLEDLVRALDAMRHQQAAELERLAARTAHETNKVAAVLLEHLDRARQAGDGPVAEQLAAIRASAERLTALANRLQLYAGEPKEPRGYVDAAAVVRDLESELAGLATVPVSIDARGPAPVASDPALLREAVAELVRNAAAARPEGIWVNVRSAELAAEDLEVMHHDGAATPGWHVLVEVTDTGDGMDADVAARALAPMFSTRPSAMGMGLAVVWGIARTHGGAIRIESVPMLGTTVLVALPQTASTGARTVLVVDDEAMIRDVASTMLRRSGYRVLVADSGEVALQMFRADPEAVDAVLLDMSMPGMSGAETLHALREVDPGVCVVVCTGYAIDDRAHLGDAVPSGFLQKPYDMRQLSEAVRRALAAMEAGS